MENEKFERLLSDIRNEQVDDQVVAQAGERVFRSIARAAPPADLSGHTLRGCQDFQALIPGYLEKTIAPARAMLFEDHVHACVACRHALENAREGAPQRVLRLETRRRNSLCSPPQVRPPVRRRGGGRWVRLRCSRRRSAWLRLATECFRGSMWFALRFRLLTALCIPGQARRCG